MNSTKDTSPATPASSTRILVAEDSPLNQQVALKQLEKLGYSADVVADGDQAVDAHRRIGYDIILMDCQMPSMSGYEATWQIRNHETESGADKRAHIIAMTANAQADNREKCTAAGMDGFINKPVLLTELEVALLHALANRAATEEIDAIIDPVTIAGLHQLRTSDKPNPVGELVDLFFQETPKQLDIMSDAVAKNDMASLSRTINAATALKGSSENLGARHLAALCDEIEVIAKTWMLADVAPLIERARKEFTRVQGALEKIKQDNAA